MTSIYVRMCRCRASLHAASRNLQCDVLGTCPSMSKASVPRAGCSALSAMTATIPSVPRELYASARKQDRILLNHCSTHSDTVRNRCAELHNSGCSVQLKVSASLRQKDGNGLLSALRQVMEHYGGLKILPATTRKEILTTLAPHLVRLRSSMGRPRARFNELLEPDQPNHELYRVWTAHLEELTSFLRRSSIQLDTFDYRQLLQFAREAGSRQIAQSMWEDMKMNSIEPDVACYNYLMDTINFEEAPQFTIGGSRRMNTTLARSQNITELVKEMRSKGLEPDCTTYCHLIRALSRDGQLHSAYTVLCSIWNIDHGLLDRNELESSTPIFPEMHHLQPTERLLATVADAFGQHDQVSIALRVIDHMAQQYRMDIPAAVWHKLLQWTLLHIAAGRKTRDRTVAPQNPDGYEKICLLVRTMLQPPYSIEPTPEMLHLLMHSSLGRRLVGNAKFLFPAEAGRLLYAGIVMTERATRFAMQKAQDKPHHAAPGGAWRKLNMQKRWLRTLLHAWATRVLRNRVPQRALATVGEQAAVQRWLIRGIPDFLLQWKAFMPQEVRYMCPGGAVTLKFRTAQECVEKASTRTQYKTRKKHFKWLDLAESETPWDPKQESRRIFAAPPISASRLYLEPWAAF